MISLCKALTENENLIAFWEMVFTGASALFTLVLTIIIIRQTSKLHKNQQELEERLDKNQSELQEKLNQSQIEMQQRQLKLDVYEYRREVYLGLTKIFNLCSSIEGLMNELQIDTFAPSDFVVILEKEMSEHVGDSSEIVFSLNESKHLFNDEILNRIEIVNKNFKAILSCITILNFYKSAEDEKIPKTVTKSGIIYINTICNEKEKLIELLDKELDVSCLEK